MIDLHLHLDGSLSPEEVFSLAKLSGITLPYQNAEQLRPQLEVAPDCRNLGEYLKKFDLPLQVLQTEQTLALAVYYLLKRLSEQGLCYAEIRFAPQLHVAHGLTQEQVVAAAVAGLQRGISEFGMPAQLILCCMRGDRNQSANFETVAIAKQFLGNGVCAVDLAGNEANYPTADFVSIFAIAREQKIPIIIHAGEAAGPESIRQALALGAQRIGHGIHAAKDIALLEQLNQQQIPLELCFTSNLQTKAAVSAHSFPLHQFLAHGISITVNTDNMTVSATCLHREYTLLQEQFGLSVETLQAIACNAASAAFISAAQVETLKRKIAQQFSSWLIK